MKDLSEGLHRALGADRLGHGLLFATSDGAELPPLVADFAKSLLCTARTAQATACGSCDSCRVFAGGAKSLEELAHPDFLLLRPASDVGYSVEQIRGLAERFSLGRALGAERVACLLEADRLSTGNGAAGQAFLKLLEEPRPHSRFLLVSSRLEGLSATLRSRVQVLRSPALAQATAVDKRRTEADELTDWRDLLEWVQDGAPEGRRIETPADLDAYWKDRGQAVAELKQVLSYLWENSREEWGDLEGGRRRTRFLERFEACLRAIEGYGNAPLQWLAMRSDVRLRL